MKTVATVLLVSVAVIGGGVWALMPAPDDPALHKESPTGDSEHIHSEHKPEKAGQSNVSPASASPHGTPAGGVTSPKPEPPNPTRRSVKDVARACVKRHDFGVERRARQGEEFLTDALGWLRREFPPLDASVEAAALDEIARLLIQHRAATLEWQKGTRVDSSLGDTKGQAEGARLSATDFTRRQAAFRRAELQKFADTNLNGLDAGLTQRFVTLFDTQLEHKGR